MSRVTHTTALALSHGAAMPDTSRGRRAPLRSVASSSTATVRSGVTRVNQSRKAPSESGRTTS